MRCGACAALDMQRVAREREREQLLAHAQAQLASTAEKLRWAEQQLQAARHAPAAADSAVAVPAEAMRLQIALLQQQVAALRQQQQTHPTRPEPEPMQVRRPWPCLEPKLEGGSSREPFTKSSFPQA